jgi:hypothetical protein
MSIADSFAPSAFGVDDILIPELTLDGVNQYGTFRVAVPASRPCRDQRAELPDTGVFLDNHKRRTLTHLPAALRTLPFLQCGQWTESSQRYYFGDRVTVRTTAEERSFSYPYGVEVVASPIESSVVRIIVREGMDTDQPPPPIHASHAPDFNTLCEQVRGQPGWEITELPLGRRVSVEVQAVV